MKQSRGGAPCKQSVVWKALVCKPPHLAQGCGRETAFLEQHGSQVAGENGHQGVKGLPDAVWTAVKTDQMCVWGGGWGKGGRQRRSGRRGRQRLIGRRGFRRRGGGRRGEGG